MCVFFCLGYRNLDISESGLELSWVWKVDCGGVCPFCLFVMNLEVAFFAFFSVLDLVAWKVGGICLFYCGFMVVIERLRGRILERVGLLLCVIFVELLVARIREVDLLVNIPSGGLNNLRIETCVFLCFFSVSISFFCFL